MADESELRRRAQPLLDRPPYEPLPIAALRERATTRTRRARRRLIGGLCVVVVASGTVAAVARYQGRSDEQVAVRTTDATTPHVTVPSDTTIADLRFTRIVGPDSTNRVEIYAAGDRFLAVQGDEGVARAWVGDASGRWRAIAVPVGLRGVRIGTVARLEGRFVVVGATDRGPVVLEGAALDRLKLSHWTSEASSIPAVIHPAPPPGRGIVVSGYVESTAVGTSGIVLAGKVSATFDRALLPQSVRDAYVGHLGRVDVRDGRVVAWIIDGGKERTLFDQPASALGLTAAQGKYLARSDDRRTELAVWAAAWGKPIRQLPVTGIDTHQRLGNVRLYPVTGGFVLNAPTTAGNEMWLSRDGRAWRHLASPPGEVMELVELGSRWVAPSARVSSDDRGRSWTPIDLERDLATTRGTGSLFGAQGVSAFGMLAASTPLDAATVTTHASRLLYSPDGVHWSSVALDALLDFTANVPYIAVGDRSAILGAGLRAPGVQPQRFWLVTRRR